MQSDFKKLTRRRLILACTSTPIEETLIFIAWRWLLPQWGIHLPVAVLIIAMVFWLCFSIGLFWFTTNALRRQSPAGLPSMIGTKGKATERLAPEGMAKIRNELWSVVAEDGPIEIGEEIIVIGEDGLKLHVRKRREDEPTR